MARASQDEGIASIRLALMRAHELVPAITRAGQEATALPPLSLEAIDSVDPLRGHTADDPIQIDFMHQADDSITNGVASPLGAWGNGLYAREQAAAAAAAAAAAIAAADETVSPHRLADPSGAIDSIEPTATPPPITIGSSKEPTSVEVCAITFPIGEVDANSSADPAPMAIAFDGPTGGDDDTESLRRALGAAWEMIATQAATAAQPAATPLEPIGAVAGATATHDRAKVVRFHEFSALGLVPEAKRTKAAATATGRTGPKILALVDPISPPTDFVLRVRGLSGPGGEREAKLRLTEACRIIPMLPAFTWPHALGEDAADLTTWSADRLLKRQLDCVCNMEGHGTLAKWRSTFVRLTLYLRAEGYSENALHFRIGGTIIREWLETIEDNAVAIMTARAIARGVPPESTAAGLTAAPSRLGFLRSMQTKLALRIRADAPILDTFASAPPMRDGRQALTPDLAHAIHFELGAADACQLVSTLPLGGEIVRGCHAMAALLIHVCVRTALAERSGGLEDASHEMGIGQTGVDLKKHKWGQAGRPLICHTRGFSGSREWWTVAKAVLARDGYGTTTASLLRAHDGASGNPFRATRWLDRPPTDGEWVNTLRAISSASVHVQPRPGDPWATVNPPLVTSEAAAEISMHSLKAVMITAFAAAGVHDQYLVEPGAHSGSTLERMSLDAARQQTEQACPSMQMPAGLRTARGYAHVGLAAGHATNVAMVTGMTRSFLQASGLAGLPRIGGWRALASWILNECQRGAVVTRASRPSPVLATAAAVAPLVLCWNSATGE